jgi:cation diffusion facilitator CzcD-associated flavoprotein CzcO
MHTTTTTVAANDTCDLCIIGAGIAGLNALFAATQYLPATARVILVDRNPTCGGWWTQTYDYVRLHQPHQMFTVGDLEWLWDKPREYLATGSEVLWHL